MEFFPLVATRDLDEKQRHFVRNSLQAYLDEIIQDLDCADVQEMVDEAWDERRPAPAA